MATKKHDPILDKDPMKMSREDRARWERALVQETIRPVVIGYGATREDAKRIIGRKKRCHIEEENGVYLVIQAKAR